MSECTGEQWRGVAPCHPPSPLQCFPLLWNLLLCHICGSLPAEGSGMCSCHVAILEVYTRMLIHGISDAVVWFHGNIPLVWDLALYDIMIGSNLEGKTLRGDYGGLSFTANGNANTVFAWKSSKGQLGDIGTADVAESLYCCYLLSIACSGGGGGGSSNWSP